MPVTRIKNNQITDATINAAAKVTSYSITSGLLANSLTYGSDLTITGNLTVNGSSTTIDTVDLIVEDPIIILAANQTGSPSVDIGFIGKRGTSTNVAFVWDESSGAFLTAFTNSAATNTVITISSFADFQAANITANTNLSVVGTTSLTGNVIGTNTNFTGNITVGNLINNGSMSTAGNVTGANLNTGGLVSATGNVNGGNINTAGAVSATGNITGGNLNVTGNIVDTNALSIITGSSGNVSLAPGGTNVLVVTTTGANITGTLNATGNANVGNLGTAGLITATGNVTGGNLITGGLLSATGAITSGSTISATGNVTGGNLITGGLVSATGNVNGGNLISAALVQGATVSASGNIVGGNANITSAVNSATVSATGNIVGGNINTAGLVSATGAVIGGSLSTAGTVSATGNITGGNLITAGLATVTGNVNTSAGVLATGNVTGGNINTAGLITATGNITGGNLISGVVTNSAAMTISTTAGNLNLQPTGNIVLNSKYINGLNQPVQDNDAASKIYVDNLVSTQISYHQAVNAASTTTMATTTGGTITYTQPNGAANGVGALLTTTGSFNLIDSANVQTVGTRILVKNEANAVFNGVYTWANATNIVRSTDTDEYGPNSATQLSLNDYFFVTGGVVNEGSAWIVDSPTGTITFGTSNIAFAQFSQSQVYDAGNGIAITGTTISVKVDNNTTAYDGGGNVIVKAGANLTTPNIGAATGTSLSVTGNITGGNLNTGAQVIATGNITGGNIITAGLATVTGNVNTSAGVLATGNLTGGNVNTAGLITATGNITGGNLNTGAQVVATGNITGGNINTGAQVVATGNITGGNIITAGIMSSTGNGTHGNIITGGLLTATGNVNTSAGVLATGNVTGGNLITGGLITATGTITSTANVVGGNLTTGAQVSAGGNITGANLITGGLLTATGNVNTSAGVLATGNVTGGNINTAGLITATGNITGGNLNTGAQVVATGNITGGNITTTGQANLGNIRISGDTITGTNGRVNINSAAADVDFSVSGTAANVFYVDAGANSASFGSSSQITNAIVAFNTTTSIAIPTGTTGQRPGTGVTGMVRFNTSINNLEFYDANSWQTAGTTFTTITANTQSGDGTKVAFTLPVASTTAGTIVAINGVVQIPTTAYSVSNVTCTFTEAPASTDVIDFRVLATTSTVTGLASASGASLQLDPTKIELDITGNVVPLANVTYTLGNSTGYWNNVFSSTITGGNIVNSNANGVGNIGTSSGYFNTIFAKATSAQYADLAEKYVADAEYAPGTVLAFGGDAEVTLSTEAGSTRVAGVVSTNPSYIMNAGLEAEHVAMVALQGRVPCQVVGPVAKGDLMVAAGNGSAKADNAARAGTIIGKALENFDGAEGTIEVVIGRN